MKMNPMIKIALVTLTALMLVILGGCSRELTRGEEGAEQPLQFPQIPLGNEPSVQQSAAQVDLITVKMNDGRDALLDGNYQLAVEHFTGVLEEDENHTGALYNLGYAYRYLDDYEHAIEFASRAVESDPEKLYVHQNLALAYEGAGDIDSAIVEFEEERTLHPDEPSLGQMTGRLAMLYLDRDLPDEAFDAAMHAVNLEPEVASHHATMAEVHMYNNAWQQAIDKWDDAISLLDAVTPESASLLIGLADALWEAGRIEEARLNYREAISLNPDLETEIEPGRLEPE